MPRPRKIDRPKKVEFYLPESVHSKLTFELYSELEGRIPHGRLTTLFTQLTTEWLEARGIEV